MNVAASSAPLPVSENKQARLEINLVRTKKKNHDIDGVRKAGHQVTAFFTKVGGQVESFIDSTPFGVPDPEPWSPETDRTAAALCDPIAALNLLPATPFAVLASCSQSLLMSLRMGLENTDEPVMISVADADTIVPKEGGADAFIDLGADKWGNSTRQTHPWDESITEVKVIHNQVKRALSDFTMNKFLPFVDNITLRANGIIVTNDDCSVECSVASLVDDVTDGECPSLIAEQEDCPSIETEITLDEFEDAKTDPAEEEVLTTPEGIKIEIDCSSEQEKTENSYTNDNDEDFVMAEQEEENDDEDFVDIFDEDFDVASVH